MSDDGQPAQGESPRHWAAQGSVESRIVAERESIEAKRADIAERARRARGEMAERGLAVMVDEVRDSQARMTILEATSAAHDEEIAAIKAGLAAAFEFAGKDIPQGLAEPSQRPELKLIQGGLAS